MVGSVRCGLILAGLVLAGVPGAAFAQYAGTNGDLNDTQRAGKLLFAQHCGVCHAKPTITTKQFGPVLYKATVDGKESAAREFIKAGTPRMPGFRHFFKDEQIDAIVAFLKTLPEPEHEAPAGEAPRRGAGGMNFD
jgi:mono/diheme cytochrome c family protein